MQELVDHLGIQPGTCGGKDALFLKHLQRGAYQGEISEIPQNHKTIKPL